jgi:hypothetical protein
MQTQLASASPVHAKPCPCIGKTKYTPYKSSLSGFYLLQQSAFGALAITEQATYTHIIGKQGQQECILAIAFEVLYETHSQYFLPYPQ